MKPFKIDVLTKEQKEWAEKTTREAVKKWQEEHVRKEIRKIEYWRQKKLEEILKRIEERSKNGN